MVNTQSITITTTVTVTVTDKTRSRKTPDHAREKNCLASLVKVFTRLFCIGKLVTDSTRSKKTPDSGDLSCAKNRLASYEKWPAKDVSPEKLAAAGFVYTGNLDEAKCIFCGLMISQWAHFHDPVCEHLIWLPECPYIQGETSDKIPLWTAALNSLKEKPLAALLNIIIRLVTKKKDVDQIFPSPFNLAKQNIFERPATINDAVSTTEKRLKTFDGDPNISVEHARLMAEAGFYYTGHDIEKYKCYCCLFIPNICPVTDDPWITHIIYVPNCYHLLITQGALKVEQVSSLYRKTVHTEKKPYDFTVSKSEDSRTSQESLQSKNTSHLAHSIDSAPNRELCISCERRPREMVFKRCTHSVVCRMCIVELAACPICMDPITVVIRREG